MVAPAARVFLRAVRAALTSTVPDLLCLLARGSLRDLASGRLPLAVHSAQHGPGSGAPWLRIARRALRFVLSKHWGDDCYLTNRLWQDLKPPSHVGNGQELRLAPPVQWALQVQGNQLQTAVLCLRMAPPEPAGRATLPVGAVQARYPSRQELPSRATRPLPVIPPTPSPTLLPHHSSYKPHPHPAHNFFRPSQHTHTHTHPRPPLPPPTDTPFPQAGAPATTQRGVSTLLRLHMGHPNSVQDRYF
nr:putative uncharacterized protein IRX2-DT isoform X1 [Gorilla gorilla gorilla]